jgi:Tfp pilus assembly protein PilN
VEAEIVVNRKMIFSRYFKFSLSSASWQSLFLDEITKTKNLFIKEVSEEPTNRIMIVGNTKIAQNLIKEIKEPREFSFEIIDLRKKIDIPDSLWKKIEEESCSFFSLIGLALAELPLSLDLLPEREKEAKKASALSRKGLRLSFFIVLAGLFFMLGTVKNLHNKANYLIRLKEELSKIEKEVRPWEEAERRKEIFKSQFSGRVAAIEIIYEINQLMPEGMFLVNLNYEEAREITLRGNTFDLNNVLNFVSRLEKSKVLKDFKIKVRYATKKKTQEGEILDFEINCTRK